MRPVALSQLAAWAEGRHLGADVRIEAVGTDSRSSPVFFHRSTRITNAPRGSPSDTDRWISSACSLSSKLRSMLVFEVIPGVSRFAGNSPAL